MLIFRHILDSYLTRLLETVLYFESLCTSYCVYCVLHGALLTAYSKVHILLRNPLCTSYCVLHSALFTAYSTVHFFLRIPRCTSYCVLHCAHLIACTVYSTVRFLLHWVLRTSLSSAYSTERCVSTVSERTAAEKL